MQRSRKPINYWIHANWCTWPKASDRTPWCFEQQEQRGKKNSIQSDSSALYLNSRRIDLNSLTLDIKETTWDESETQKEENKPKADGFVFLQRLSQQKHIVFYSAARV